MSDPHPVFRFIWRANALAIFCVMLLVGGLASYHFIRDLMRPAHRAPGTTIVSRVATVDDEGGADGQVLHVGQFARAEGSIYWAPLYTGEASEGYKSMSGVKGGRVRNVLFFDSRDGSIRRLFPDDKGRVLDDLTIAVQEPEAKTSRIVARLYIHAERDTNGDGRINGADRQRVVLTRPDGTGAQALAEDVDAFSGDPLRDNREPVFAYFVRRGTDLTFGEFDLATFTPKRTMPVKVPRS